MANQRARLWNVALLMSATVVVFVVQALRLHLKVPPLSVLDHWLTVFTVLCIFTLMRVSRVLYGHNKHEARR